MIKFYTEIKKSLKKIILLILLLFSILHSYSQSDFAATYGAFDVDDNRFTITKVIDARTQKDLGFFETDEGRMDTLLLKKPLGDFIIEFLEICNKKPKNRKNIDLILKINDYQFGTRLIKKNIYSWFYADLEFYIEEKGNYRKILTINECNEGKGLNYPTISMGRTHFYAWENTVNVLNDLCKKLPTNTTIINESELLSSKTLPLIFTDSLLNEGIYSTFTSFKFNSPTIKEAQIHKEGDDIQIFKKDNKGNFKRSTSNDSFWGFCDKKVIYIAIRKTQSAADILIPLLRFGNTFELVEGISDSKANMAANSKIMVYKVSGILNIADAGMFRPYGSPVLSLGVGIIHLLIADSLDNPNQRIMLDMNGGGLKAVKIYNVNR